MPNATKVGVLLLALTLVSMTQQRPRSYGDLKVCSSEQKCGTYAVESEEIDGKRYYVLRYYADGEAPIGGRPAEHPTGNKEAEFQHPNPIYIIGVPTGKCPEGQQPDHSGNCRDIDFR